MIRAVERRAANGGGEPPRRRFDRRQPDGFTYKVFRLEDGVSFIHIVSHEEADGSNALTCCARASISR